MNRFKNILCVITSEDTGKDLLEQAVSLADSIQAQLTVVAVAEHISIGMGMPEDGPISGDLQTAITESARQKLEKITAPFRKRRKMPCRVLVGTLFLEVTCEVLRNGYDLVIKSAENPEWLDRLMGSEDMHLLRKCPCPVWLVKPGAAGKYRRIVAAVDLDNAHHEADLNTRQLLNRDILKLASSLALANFSELHIVHAWEAIGEGAMRAGFLRMSEAGIDAYVHQVKKQRESEMARLLQELNSQPGNPVLDFIEYHVHLVKGPPHMTIPVITQKVQADMVVMGTVARVGVPGFITGNTAEMILSQIDSSVLAIKPKGFSTPVLLEEDEV